MTTLSSFALLALDDSSASDSDAPPPSPSPPPPPPASSSSASSSASGSWRPRGLVSVHNTCFVNVVLQALLGSSSFRSLLQRLPPPPLPPVSASLAAFYTQYITPPPSSSSSPSNLIEATAKEAEDAEEARSSGGFQAPRRRRGRSKRRPQRAARVPAGVEDRSEALDAIMPNSMDAAVAMFSKNAIGQHQDAHEFLHFLCQTAHEELEALERRSEAAGNDAADADNGDWQEMSSRRKKQTVTARIDFRPSLISAVFSGCLKTELRKKGTSDSLQYAPFFSVSLSADCSTVLQALTAFAAPQRIQGFKHNSQEIVADAVFRFDSVPPVLVLHLKRFCISSNGRTSKMEHHIDFDRTLKIPERCLSNRLRKTGPKSYRLFAVVVHVGASLSHGHYVAFVMHSQLGWLAFNDVRVERVAWDHVREQQAYILFYEEAAQ